MARYQKGKPPGPGRPAGSRNRSTAWLDELGGEGIETVIRTVKDAAQGGNMQAASIMLARTWPQRRGRPVTLDDLPDVATAGGLVAAQAAVIAGMAKGELTPDEAVAIAGVLEAQRRAIETHDHDRRLRALEDNKTDVRLP